MLTLSPLFSGGFGWNLEETTPVQLEECNFLYSGECFSRRNDHSDNINTGNNVVIDATSFYNPPGNDVILAPPPPLVSIPQLIPFGAAEEDRSENHVVGSEQSSQQLFSNGADEMASTVVKKLNHNASERDRRRKLNGLYSSLRSLLPPSHHSKKLSIPATVSRVLKYIPELQREVEELIRKKDELLLRRNSSTTQTTNSSAFNGNRTANSALTSQQGSISQCYVQVTQISSAEVMIRISSIRLIGQSVIAFSEVLRELEDVEGGGLYVVDVSYFESFGGRVFFSIYLLVEGGRLIKCESLNEKVLSCYRRLERLCQWMS